MPKLELELDDKGELVKTPAELEALFKRTETAGYGNGLKKGREDALTEAQKAAEERIAAERAKWEKENPVGRVKELEEENLRFREAESTITKRYADSAREREELHAREMAQRNADIAKRDARLKDALKATIRVAAVSAGARDESLDELESLLVSKIRRNADLEPEVFGDDDKPVTVQGKPVTVEAFVRQYIDKHTHHKKPAGGVGGGARGGASLHGQTSNVSLSQAKARIVEDGDRSPDAVNALFEAGRKRAS